MTCIPLSSGLGALVRSESLKKTEMYNSRVALVRTLSCTRVNNMYRWRPRLELRGNKHPFPGQTIQPAWGRKINEARASRTELHLSAPFISQPLDLVCEYAMHTWTRSCTHTHTYKYTCARALRSQSSWHAHRRMFDSCSNTLRLR